MESNSNPNSMIEDEEQRLSRLQAEARAFACYVHLADAASGTSPPPVKVTTSDKLWPNGKPHITADNFFTHEKLLKWLGENGYGYLGTAARNKLWKGIDKKYFHSLDSKNISLCVLFLGML